MAEPAAAAPVLALEHVSAGYGETVVLVTAVAAKELKLDTDFFPLTVDYQERTFAAGKIPGGFFKREGRPSEKEILTCRLIDRSIRPLFSEGLRCETQIIATVLSADRENDPDVVAMLGTSAALHVSDIPFNGPLAGVRVGRVNGQWIVNPTQSQLPESDTDIFLSGSRDAIVMVEGGAQVISSFLQSRLVDQVVLTIAPRFLSGYHALEGSNPALLPRLESWESRRYGDDLVLFGRSSWETLETTPVEAR